MDDVELRHLCSWSEIVITEAGEDEVSAFSLDDPTIVPSALSLEGTRFEAMSPGTRPQSG